METSAVNVERQRRKRIFVKVLAIQSPPLFSKDMGANLSAEFSKETAVIAVIFPRNSGNRRYFSMKYRPFRDIFPPIRRNRRKISAKISTRVTYACQTKLLATVLRLASSQFYFFQKLKKLQISQSH